MFSDAGLPTRLLKFRFALMDHHGAPAHRKNVGSLVRNELLNRRRRRFGDPFDGRETAREFCADVLAGEFDRDDERRQDLDEEARQRLRDLGYADDEIG